MVFGARRAHPRARPAVSPVPRSALGLLAGRRQDALRELRRGARLLPALGQSGRAPAARPVRRERAARTARGRTRSARACSSSISCRTSRSTIARTASTCRRTRWRASASREEQIARGDTGGRWRELMAFQVERARGAHDEARRSAARSAGRIGLELRMIVAGRRCASSRKSSRSAATCSTTGRCCGRSTGRSCCCAPFDDASETRHRRP